MGVTLLQLRTFVVSAAICLVLLAGAASVRAQQAGAERARKVDEFGRLRGCDGGARLDNFAIELQNAPGSKGYIVARDARASLPGAAHAWGAYFLRYFVEMRGMEGSRFVLVDGARVSGDELSMELWLVPEGAEPPAVKPPGKKEARPFSGKYTELSVFSDTVFYDVDGTEAGAFSTGTVYAAYRGLLKKQPDSQGYLVVRSPPGAAPGYWRRAGTREKEKLSGPELPPERLTVINGGAVAPKKKAAKAEGEEEEVYGSVELWVGAKDVPPVRHVEEDAALNEAVLIGHNNFLYEELDVAGWLLKNLVEMMRADRRSVGCIIVFPGDGSGVPAGEAGAEVLPPDVFKMAQGWKDELLKKHGFEPQRVVVLSGPPEGGSAGKLELWVVPHGAPLPDPFANAEGTDGEAGEEGEAEGGAEQPQPPARTEE